MYVKFCINNFSLVSLFPLKGTKKALFLQDPPNIHI